MKRPATMPAMAEADLSSQLMPLQRQVSAGAAIYNNKESPLLDLAPLALPGLSQRVMTRGRVTSSCSNLNQIFTPQNFSAQTSPGCFSLDNKEGGEFGEEEIIQVRSHYTPALILASCIGLLPALQYGFNNASMNTGATAMRESLGIPIGSVDHDAVWGLCISIFCISALGGCTMSAPLADSLGRRKALLVNSGIYMVGGLLQAGSSLPRSESTAFNLSVLLMMLGRMVSGVAGGATTVLVPMYLGEISPPDLRGALGTGFQLVTCFAMLLAQVFGLPRIMGNESLWSWYMLLPIIPATLHAFLYRKHIESPRWHARHGIPGVAYAREALVILRAEWGPETPELTAELDLMVASANPSNGQEGSSAKTTSWRDPCILKACSISVACALAQQLSGINNAFNYSSTFLAQNGIAGETVTLIAVLMNLGNVVVTLVASNLMDRAGRKSLMLISCGGMIISIAALSLALNSPGQSWTSPLAIVSVVSFVMSFGIGMGPIPWLLPAEIFPISMSAQGTSLAASCNWLANFFVVQAFPAISDNLQGFCFVPFAVVLVAFVIFICRCVPETRGKSIDEIMAELRAK